MAEPTPPARGPLLDPASLSPDQRALYDELCSGPRAGAGRPRGPVDDEGRLAGPFNAMLYVPTIGGPLQRLGAALRYTGDLDDVVRELVILRVAGHHASAYERQAHRQVARRLGVAETLLAAVDRGVPSDVSATAAAALGLAQRILDRDLPDDAEYARLHAVLGEAGVFEVNALVGYYSLLATQLALFGVRAPTEEELR